MKNCVFGFIGAFFLFVCNISAMAPTEYNEEGWRKRNTFVVSINEREYDLKETHKRLAITEKILTDKGGFGKKKGTGTNIALAVFTIIFEGLDGSPSKLHLIFASSSSSLVEVFFDNESINFPDHSPLFLSGGKAANFFIGSNLFTSSNDRALRIPELKATVCRQLDRMGKSFLAHSRFQRELEITKKQLNELEAHVENPPQLAYSDPQSIAKIESENVLHHRKMNLPGRGPTSGNQDKQIQGKKGKGDKRSPEVVQTPSQKEERSVSTSASSSGERRGSPRLENTAAASAPSTSSSKPPLEVEEAEAVVGLGESSGPPIQEILTADTAPSTSSDKPQIKDGAEEASREDPFKELEHYRDAEQYLIKHLNDPMTVRELSTIIRNKIGGRQVFACILNLHTRLFPCHICASSLFRELELEDGFANQIRISIGERQHMRLPEFMLMVSYREDYPNRKSQFTGVDSLTEDKLVPMPIGDYFPFFPTIKIDITIEDIADFTSTVIAPVLKKKSIEEINAEVKYLEGLCEEFAEFPTKLREQIKFWEKLRENFKKTTDTSDKKNKNKQNTSEDNRNKQSLDKINQLLPAKAGSMLGI